MSKFLCTFSGQLGDSLWSLPTVRAVSEIVGEKVDFATMGRYASIISLVQAQPYVDKAFGVEDWIQMHSNHGAQPWHPPARIEKDYQRCWHLGYRGHPGINAEALPLIDFVAFQQGIKFTRDPIPFISTPQQPLTEAHDQPVAYAFNTQYNDVKQKFLQELVAVLPDCTFTDVSKLPWLDAAVAIKNSVCFVGCRSANYVLAHGVGQKVICFEPHPARHASGSLGKIFGNPYGHEMTVPINLPIRLAAEVTAVTIKNWRQTNESPTP